MAKGIVDCILDPQHLPRRPLGYALHIINSVQWNISKYRAFKVLFENSRNHQQSLYKDNFLYALHGHCT